MNRIFDICSMCKLDEENLCDYSCIKERENQVSKFYVCSNFIYDDKKPITNAEMFSTQLKNDNEIDNCVKCIYDEFPDSEDLIYWLRKDAEFTE